VGVRPSTSIGLGKSKFEVNSIGKTEKPAILKLNALRLDSTFPKSELLLFFLPSKLLITELVPDILFLIVVHLMALLILDSPNRWDWNFGIVAVW
jgi:hypothetical protein